MALTVLVTPANYQYSKNPIVFKLSTNITGVDNYKMVGEVWMESSVDAHDFSKAGVQELDPLNGVCIFDFQKIIDAYLQYNVPSYGLSTFALANMVFKNFYIKYREKYGSPVVEQTAAFLPTNPIVSTYYQAHKAGIPVHEFVGNTTKVNDRLRTTGTALTRQPRNKLIRADQKEFLYFFINLDNADIAQVKYIITKQNGDVVNVLSGDLTVSSRAPYIIAAGFNQSGLSSTVDFSDIKKYTVQLIQKSSSNVISEVFTYIPDVDYYVDETIFYFTNCLGGFDTVRFTGTKETSFEIEKETVQKIMLYDTPIVNGAFSEVNINKKDSFKVASGWLTKAQVDWLEDFFIAEQKFTEAYGQFIPIILKSNTFKKYDSRSGKTPYEFEYYHAFTNSVANSI